MITTRPWLGISPTDWFINSDTPHDLLDGLIHEYAQIA
jgi:hypothetical protein